jgi:hypothetical protein
MNEAVAADYTAVVVGFSVGVLQPSWCLASLSSGLIATWGRLLDRRLLLDSIVPLGAAPEIQHDPTVFEGPVAGDVGPSHVN